MALLKGQGVPTPQSPRAQCTAAPDMWPGSCHRWVGVEGDRWAQGAVGGGGQVLDLSRSYKGVGGGVHLMENLTQLLKHLEQRQSPGPLPPRSLQPQRGGGSPGGMQAPTGGRWGSGEARCAHCAEPGSPGGFHSTPVP